MHHSIYPQLTLYFSFEDWMCNDYETYLFGEGLLSNEILNYRTPAPAGVLFLGERDAA